MNKQDPQEQEGSTTQTSSLSGAELGIFMALEAAKCYGSLAPFALGRRGVGEFQLALSPGSVLPPGAPVLLSQAIHGALPLRSPGIFCKEEAVSFHVFK